ncbi:MAG: hypothetical protein AAF565_10445 [Pseudomonadota bacterium]
MAKADLSAILVTDEDGVGLTRIIDRLSKLNGAGRLEVVVGAPDPAALVVDPEKREAFAAFSVIEADVSTTARARAAAIRAASCDIIVITEDHAFPIDDDWVERHLAAHAEGHVGVGPLMCNANPSSGTGWANLIVEYTQWLDVAEPTKMISIPGHNSSYKRDALLAYGDDLSEMLEAEWHMHLDMGSRGETLLLDPRIRVSHLNPAYPGHASRLQILAGWMFAASRARNWPLWKRIAWALSFPAIVAIRCVRILATALSSKRLRAQLPLTTYPMIVFLLLCSGIGEGIGYAIGDGGRRGDLAEYEYRRWQLLRPDDPVGPA